MSLFRGYVRVTDDKTPLDKFKNGGRPLEEVQHYRGYAGVLASDVVLIDVDDKKWGTVLFNIIEQKELKCQVRETDRGFHFYFKNNGSFDKCGGGQTLAIGIKADIKVGSSNAIANLKLGGRERGVIYDKFDDEEYDFAPQWLRPVGTKVDLLGKAEGDGRNNALFAYILPLQAAKFTENEIRETLAIVNWFIFDEPLSQTEFDTVTREEAFKKAVVPNFFSDKGQFYFDEFALYMINQHHIKRVNGRLHCFEGGVYVSDVRKLERLMLDLIPTLSKRQRSEALAYIDVMCTEDVEMADVKFIAFNNGILNIETGTLMDFDPSIVITNKIPWNYRADAYDAVVDKTLGKLACGDAEIRALLEEAAGYCLYRRNELRKSFILLGDKANGKSSYINMIGTMLGNDNICAMDMNEVGQHFETVQLFGKLANLGDDIGDSFIADTSIFKKLVSGDKVSVRYKGENSFFFSNYAKFIFSANSLPRVKDRTQAVLDRMIIIRFKATFSKSDPDYDPFISDKLKERGAIEYLIKLGVEGLKRVLDRYAFTASNEVERELKEYNEENNPILVFVQELDEDELSREPVSYWYMRYCEHCVLYGCNPISRIHFSKVMLKEFPKFEVKQRKVDGKNHRFLMKREG